MDIEALRNRRTNFHQFCENGDFEIVKETLSNGSFNYNINTPNQKGQNALHIAIRSDQYEICQLLIKKGIRINEQEGETSLSALHISVISKKEKFVKLLIQELADPTLKDQKGWTPLHWAMHLNYTEIVSILCESSKNIIEIADPDGYLPLHVGVVANSIEACEYLIKKYKIKNFYTKNKEGFTPVHLAAKYGHVEMLEMFSKLKLKLKSFSKEKSNALHYASENGKILAVEFLVDHGLSMKSTNAKRKTPLTLAQMNKHHEVCTLLIEKGARSAIHEYVKHGNVQKVKKLFKKRSEIEDFDSDGNKPIHLATIHNRFEITQILISQGADLDSINGNKYTPLHISIINGNYSIATLLITNGASLTKEDGDGNSALHLSVIHNQMEITRAIAATNFDMNTKNREGTTALNMAAQQDNFEIFQILLDFGGNPNITDQDLKTPLHEAVERSHLGFLQNLFGSGLVLDIDARDDIGRTPLMYAIEVNKPKIVNLLIHNGADINLLDKDGNGALHYAIRDELEDILAILLKNSVKICNSGDGLSPFHLAIKHNQKLECSKLLLDAHVELDIQDKDGNQPIHFAAITQKFEFVAWIQKAGGKLDAENISKNTPLHISAEKGKLDSVRLLLLKGANPNVRNARERTPLHLACENGFLETARELIQYHAELEAVDLDRNTPLDVAVKGRYVDIAQLLVTHGVYSPLKQAIDIQSPNLLDALVTAGCPIELRDTDGNTPLNASIHMKSLIMVRAVLAHKPNTSVNSNLNLTPIQGAALWGDSQAVIALLKAGVRLTGYTDGAYPHMLAKEAGNTECHQILELEYKRTCAFLEILETERSYVQILELLARHVMRPLLSNRIITREESDLIFSNIEDIYQLNLKFLAHLESEFRNWTYDSTLGNVVMHYVAPMRIYLQYNINFDASLSTIQRCMKNSSFANFARRIEEDPRFRRLEIQSILIKPVQRIPQYSLLLEKVLKETPNSHPDRHFLQIAIFSLRKFAIEINESKRSHETQVRIAQIQRMMKGLQLDLLADPSRKLLDEANFYVYSPQLFTTKKKRKLLSKLKRRERRRSQLFNSAFDFQKGIDMNINDDDSESDSHFSPHPSVSFRNDDPDSFTESANTSDSIFSILQSDPEDKFPPIPKIKSSSPSGHSQLYKKLHKKYNLSNSAKRNTINMFHTQITPIETPFIPQNEPNDNTPPKNTFSKSRSSKSRSSKSRSPKSRSPKSISPKNTLPKKLGVHMRSITNFKFGQISAITRTLNQSSPISIQNAPISIQNSHTTSTPTLNPFVRTNSEISPHSQSLSQPFVSDSTYRTTLSKVSTLKHLFLFSDYLIICNTKSKIERMFSVEAEIPLISVFVKNTSRVQFGGKIYFSFKIITSEGTFSISSSNRRLIETWRTALSDATKQAIIQHVLHIHSQSQEFQFLSENFTEFSEDDLKTQPKSDIVFQEQNTTFDYLEPPPNPPLSSPYFLWNCQCYYIHSTDESSPVHSVKYLILESNTDSLKNKILERIKSQISISENDLRIIAVLMAKDFSPMIYQI
ncbi:pote ankyrin domain [Anaeramoeba ignava]|uniref:Pote ankyrin domain n=1 Tax=Anaeramoeba ignava TaxID=1746090 RepID=A0A9Q0LUK9_ANAIG|nr:pote ankyrin domain [Anaeramoeba ignava]